jgi:hypothetical protein
MLAHLAPHDKPHTGRGGLAGRPPAPTPSATLARRECPGEAAQAEHGRHLSAPDTDKFFLEGIKIFPGLTLVANLWLLYNHKNDKLARHIPSDRVTERAVYETRDR